MRSGGLSIHSYSEIFKTLLLGANSRRTKLQTLGAKKGLGSTRVQRATASSHAGGANEFENFSCSPADVHGQVREKPIKARSTNDKKMLSAMQYQMLVFKILPQT